MNKKHEHDGRGLFGKDAAPFDYIGVSQKR